MLIDLNLKPCFEGKNLKCVLKVLISRLGAQSSRLHESNRVIKYTVNRLGISLYIIKLVGFGGYLISFGII